MRLNLGCGNRKKKGWVNVDLAPECRPDAVVDLEDLPWPWADDSVDEVMLSHVLEHLGRETRVYLGIFKELWRVCKAGAKITVIVPHPRHDHFLNDPTHVRPVTAQGLELLSQERNREWEKKGVGNTPLGLYLGVDFRLDSVSFNPDEPWRSRYRKGELSPEGLDEAMRLYNNVISEVTVVLRAVKPPSTYFHG